MVLRNSDELDLLIDPLFDSTTLLDTNRRPVIQEFDVTRQVAEALLSQAQSLEEAGLQVSMGATDPVMIHSERDRLRRIVSNPISNAATHGSTWLRVEVACQATTVRLVFANGINDDDPVDPTRIFERSYTQDAARSTRHQGLGLAIVRGVTEQIGGNCWAETSRGPGPGQPRSLTVTVELPVGD